MFKRVHKDYDAYNTTYVRRSLRASELWTGHYSSMHPTAVAGGLLVYAGAAYGAYWFAKSHKPEDVSGADPGSTGGCAFDRLATSYDTAIGSEERVMGYGLMRSWLLRNVKGDVLEISAGTGRNLDHYRLADISSLTLTDVSAPMLQQAEDKYFNQLQLHYKHPHLRPLFLLGTAELMVADHGTAPAQHGLRAAAPTAAAAGASPASSSQASSRNPAPSAAGAGGTSTSSGETLQEASPFSSLWRLSKQQQSQQSASSSSSGLDPPAAPQTSPPAAPCQVDAGKAALSSAGTSSSDSGSSSQTAINRSPTSSSSSSSSSSGSDGSSQTAGSSTSNSGRGGWWGGCRGACSTCQQHRQEDHLPSSSSSSSTFAPGSFDAVVDTFGLCSHEHPVKALQQAAALLKPGGRLYLLEHGRSSSWFGWVRDWLNDYMDRRAPAHHVKWGCWYNRDILDIVQQAHLQVVSCFTWHAGTSYLIVAEPDQVAAQAGDTPAAPAA